MLTIFVCQRLSQSPLWADVCNHVSCESLVGTSGDFDWREIFQLGVDDFLSDSAETGQKADGPVTRWIGRWFNRFLERISNNGRSIAVSLWNWLCCKEREGAWAHCHLQFLCHSTKEECGVGESFDGFWPRFTRLYGLPSNITGMLKFYYSFIKIEIRNWLRIYSFGRLVQMHDWK